MRALLVIEAYLGLVRHDRFMAIHEFRDLCRMLQEFPLESGPGPTPPLADIGFAVDAACAFYPKRVLCLQRSAVLLTMLRARGIRAELVIGTQILPFKAHAWVRVDGEVLGDRLASREAFDVLEVL